MMMMMMMMIYIVPVMLPFSALKMGVEITKAICVTLDDILKYDSYLPLIMSNK